METGLDTANQSGAAQTSCTADAIQPGTQAACTADAIQPGEAGMKRYKILDANAIKLIAIIAMTIDHIAWAIYPGCPLNWKPELMHVIGRITMPTMCFFVAEGFFHTRNVSKYTARMFLFALISHFAYVSEWNGFGDWRPFVPLYYSGIWEAIRFRDMSFLNSAAWHSQTSVIWTLAWGLVMLRVEYSERIRSAWLKTLLICLICVVSFPGDWSCTASVLVLSFGTNRGHWLKQTLWLIFYVGSFGILFMPNNLTYAFLQLSVVLAIPILLLYNGKRGPNPAFNAFMKWFFYIYYPLHLLILGLLRSHGMLPAYYF